MLIKSLLLRNLSGCCDTDQVVREPDRSAGINGDAARDKLTHRPLDPAHLPPLQLGRIAKGQRTAGDCKQPEHAAGVAARTAQPRRHEPTGIDLGSRSSDKRFKPKRGTTRPRHQLTRRRVGKPWIQHADQLERLAARQRAKLETQEVLRRQHPSERLAQ